MCAEELSWVALVLYCVVPVYRKHINFLRIYLGFTYALYGVLLAFEDIHHGKLQHPSRFPSAATIMT